MRLRKGDVVTLMSLDGLDALPDRGLYPILLGMVKFLGRPVVVAANTHPEATGFCVVGSPGIFDVLWIRSRQKPANTDLRWIRKRVD